MSQNFVKISKLKPSDQQAIHEIIKNYLEESGRVYSDEWGYSYLNVNDGEIEFDLTIDLRS